jgi:hypothetical protein
MRIPNSLFFHKEIWKLTIVQNEIQYDKKNGHMEKWYVQPMTMK